MAQLDRPGDLTRPDVAGARTENVQVGPRLGGCVRLAGHGEGEPARGGDARVAHDRRGQELGASCRQPGSDLSRRLDRDRRQVDHDRRRAVAAARQQAGRAQQGVNQVLRCANHDEDDACAGEVGRPLDDLGPVGCQWLRLGLRPVVHRHVQAGREQSAHEHRAHPPGAQPADLALRVIGHACPTVLGNLSLHSCAAAGPPDRRAGRRARLRLTRLIATVRAGPVRGLAQSGLPQSFATIVCNTERVAYRQ